MIDDLDPQIGHSAARSGAGSTRRGIVRAAAAGLAGLLVVWGLAACGGEGEDEEDGEDGDDEEDDD